jgi:pimeloyl-ACP methyl ester carboxylesterase
MVEREVMVRGVRLLVREQGEGPPLLLGHGMWCDGTMFAELAGHLGGWRIITPDLRGHGRSGLPASAWTIADLSEDYAVLLDALRIDQAMIAGFSMGGMAALQFALDYPTRTRGLVLIGTTAASEDLTRTIQINVLTATLGMLGPRRWIAREGARRTFSAKFRRTNPELVEAWCSVVERMERAALVRAIGAVGTRPTLVDRLREIQAPTLVIAGSADKLLPSRESRMMARRLPNASLEIHRGAGHAVSIERAEAVARQMQNFMKKI